MNKGEKEMKKKFELGKLFMTKGVAENCNYEDLFECVKRHSDCDWGDLDEDDKLLNDMAVENGERILSAYELFGTKIWIITEWDRSVTTILLPEEY